MFKFTRHQLIAAYAIVGLALIGVLVMVFKPNAPVPAGDIRIIEPRQTALAPEVTELSTDQLPVPPPTMLCVHVAGKVKAPGVYDLGPGTRIKDAVEAAGGALPNADLESINLAEKVEDGQQIYVAAKGQIPPPAVSVVRGGAPKPAKSEKKSSGDSTADDTKKASEPEKLSAPGQGTVNINSAGLEELQRLPGIGPAYAERIIEYRTQHGRFQAIEELDEVKGIGPKTLEKLRPFVTL